MNLNLSKIGHRDRHVLSGLFLSKFDVQGLNILGFKSFTEAFNVLGYSLGAKPASIKNYRDEFDPLFPNPRKGWHNRKLREYCANVANKYGELDMADFANLLESLMGKGEPPSLDYLESESFDDSETSFAKRLTTGLAAEKYFQSVYAKLPEYNQFELEDTTKLGCGYDFRLWPSNGIDFIAVEVKGLSGRTGTVSMTDKEYAVAKKMKMRFSLFVVNNFIEKPFHMIYMDPLGGILEFTRMERTEIRTSWQTGI